MTTTMINNLPQNSPEFKRRLFAGAIWAVTLLGGLATFTTVYGAEQDKGRRVVDRAVKLYECSDEIFRYSGRPDVVSTVQSNDVPQSIRVNCDKVLGEFGGKTTIPSAFKVYGLATLEHEKSKSDSAVTDVVLASTVGLVGALLAGFLPGVMYERRYGRNRTW